MGEPQWRSDPDRKRDQVRRANRARHRAVQQLIRENQARYNALYVREAAIEGVTAAGPNRRTQLGLGSIEALRRRLARLEEQVGAK